MRRIAELEVVKLTDDSKVYNVIIRNGVTRVVRLECESRSFALTIISAINEGVIGVVTL